VRRAGSSSFSVRGALVLAAAVLALACVAGGCGGSDDEATSEPPPTMTDTEPGDGQAASGAQLFSDNCESCHGVEGAGGHVGPNLQTSPVAENLSQVETQVRDGAGAMPAFSGALSDEEIDVVAQYVVEQVAPKG
jgi:mono/diheme cytochrome c family protein